MASYGSAESVLVRADAYRVGMKTMSWIALTMAIVASAGVGSAAYLATHKPEPRYFATTNEGQIQPIVPLNQPHLTPSAVNRFAVEAVTSSLTYDFANYRADFQDAQRWFVKPTGWNSFVEAIQRSGTLDLVKKRKFNTTAIAQNAIILQEGVRNGVYEWRVQMPVKVAYQSSSEVTSQDLIVTVRLQRLHTYQSPEAVAIGQFVATPG